MVINGNDAKNVVAALAAHLRDVSADDRNFERLPDSFWGYYARGHDHEGTFGAIVVYADNEDEIDHLIKMFETWTSKKTSSK